MSSATLKKYYEGAEKILVAIDCIIFGFDKETLKLLLFKRKIAPFAGEWSLIGSFVQSGESVPEAAQRVLEESTGLNNVYLEEMGSYSDLQRDPGSRVISIAHYALIRLDEHKQQLVETHQARWFPYDDLPDLILDHQEMTQNALAKLRRKARYQPIGFELLPEKFTLPQLQLLYQAIYQKKLDRRNFRKKILSMKILEKLDEKDKTNSRKGAFLYRFDEKKYQELERKGMNFEL
ncbi:NUDIX hydrolase [Flavilitoribacter nigricans]|uniref:DNA mismatch repair protein MutT n=1 Tax=Flavilitoribacter nigricans (strain ATCC 23147 / DSM 23189 / NBRC 102662 / NCIMB 1420 / SS-2) TaxID=1122177 RepID=A0A2D0NB10_FLAN2|nr:NUDIX domain-containing protein [Flavilitoribacter nigricans]PHN05694.1 DNA mismatch repair protein MutT [Flavilitoribacter nigricans DSM 23189 = NBRC 102662]